MNFARQNFPDRPDAKLPTTFAPGKVTPTGVAKLRRRFSQQLADQEHENEFHIAS